MEQHIHNILYRNAENSVTKSIHLTIKIKNTTVILTTILWEMPQISLQ